MGEALHAHVPTHAHEMPRWLVKLFEILAFVAVMAILIFGAAAFMLSTEDSGGGSGPTVRETLPSATGSDLTLEPEG